jgi:hypothetical protein
MTHHNHVMEKTTVPRYITRWIDDRLYIFDVASNAFFELSAPAGHAFERLMAGDAPETIAAAAPPQCHDACRAFLRELIR